ncbi:MAG: hypothetical protein P4M14_11045 [Gammaproteobacteria bacterium]|nr:hypothetical protein [Gammaproteobacteria bacterium]
MSTSRTQLLNAADDQSSQQSAHPSTIPSAIKLVPTRFRQSDAEDHSQQLKAFLKTKKNNLINAKPLLGISVGKDYHEGEHLLAIFSALNGHLENDHFHNQSIVMLVGGTLQRHNFWTFTQKLSDAELAIKLKDLPENTNDADYLESLALIFAEKFLPNAKALEESYLSDSEKMLSENTMELEKLRPRLKVMKWSDFVTGVPSEASNVVSHTFISAYNNKRAAVLNLYKTSDQFRCAVEATVDDFLQDKSKLALIEAEVYRMQRLVPTLSNVNFTRLARILSKNYLLEEIPFFLALAEDQGFTHNVYPAKSAPKALELAFKLLNTKTLEWTPIAFNQINPQKLADRAEKLALRKKIEDELTKQLEEKRQQELVQQQEKFDLHNKQALQKIELNTQAAMRARFRREVMQESLPPLSEQKEAPEGKSREEKYPSPRALLGAGDQKEGEPGNAEQFEVLSNVMIRQLLKNALSGRARGPSQQRPLSAPPAAESDAITALTAGFSNGNNAHLAKLFRAVKEFTLNQQHQESERKRPTYIKAK